MTIDRALLAPTLDAETADRLGRRPIALPIHRHRVVERTVRAPLGLLCIRIPDCRRR
jgi:hypothetical protein